MPRSGYTMNEHILHFNDDANNIVFGCVVALLQVVTPKQKFDLLGINISRS